MEYTSQSVLHFPAAYAPISEDEMIYLDGGDAISPQQFTFNLVTNLIRLMGQAAFSGALNGLSNMRNDGLTTGGAIAHYWNRQNTMGKVATVVFTGCGGAAGGKGPRSGAGGGSLGRPAPAAADVRGPRRAAGHPLF